MPLPFKVYSTLDGLPLPLAFAPSDASALEALAGPTEDPAGSLDLNVLARLCYFSNGITRVLRRGRQPMAFRAAACTGAMYHVELYVMCGELPALEAGVYHYAAHDNTLRCVRRGDYRQVLVSASGGEPSLEHAPAVLACTSTFWRNAWKYTARAYRHTFWDTGTVLANLLGVASANAIRAQLILGFADQAVNDLLDIDATDEAAVCLVALGRVATPPPDAPSVDALHLPTRPLSPRQITYSEITEAHAASSLASGAEAAAWRQPPAAPPGPGQPPGTPAGPAGQRAAAHSVLDEPRQPADSLEAVILRRGSSRQFSTRPIAMRELTDMLDVATGPLASDIAHLGKLTRPYLIVNAVDGLASGTYVYERHTARLELLSAGDFRAQAAFLDLGQPLAGQAAVNVYWLAELAAVDARLGNRGYRAAQLEAAIEAGKLYLAAYALRLGATGLTFFDDMVTDFFSPQAAGSSVMFLLAVGHPKAGQPR